MKTVIKVEVLGRSNSIFVSIGDHVIKSYDSYGKKLDQVISTAEKYAMKYINKFFSDGGIIDIYKHNLHITHIEL